MLLPGLTNNLDALRTLPPKDTSCLDKVNHVVCVILTPLYLMPAAMLSQRRVKEKLWCDASFSLLFLSLVSTQDFSL